MANFNYSAKNSSNQTTKGRVSADSQAEAITQIRGRGLIILHLDEIKQSSSAKFGGSAHHFLNRVSEKDKIIFTQQLAIMSQAGLPISQALRALVEETANKHFTAIIQTIAVDVEGGTALSIAFAKHPDTFSRVYTSILKAGEKSGKVDEVLSKLAAQLEKDYDIKSKVKSALAYPAFVTVAMLVIVSLIMIFIIPQIQSIFAENNAKLPVLTTIVIGISNILRHQWYIILGILLLGFFGLRQYNHTASGKMAIDKFKLNVPIFGTLNRKVSIARFARIFSTLLSSGIPMLEIFETCQDVMGNEVFRVEIGRAAKDIESGVEISAALKKQPHIPRMVTQLTAVGEKSGNIDVIYNNLANFMEKEVDNVTRNMTALLEPALMLVMGAVIGTIVIAILLPIYALTTNVL